jgi:hypothetical protein
VQEDKYSGDSWPDRKDVAAAAPDEGAFPELQSQPEHRAGTSGKWLGAAKSEQLCGKRAHATGARYDAPKRLRTRMLDHGLTTPKDMQYKA